jgi:hypothetical protein
VPSLDHFQLFLPLLATAVMAVSAPAPGPSINNSVLVSLPKRVAHQWTLEFLAGQGPGDRITITPAQGSKGTVALQKPGDAFELAPGGHWVVTFAPNFGEDGACYWLALRASGEDRQLTVRAEKPVKTLLSLNARRKVFLTPDWNGPRSFPGPMRPEQAARMARAFRDGTWTILDDTF